MNDMKRLEGDAHQQEARASRARKLSEIIEGKINKGKIDAQVTLKGEAVDVLRKDKKMTITANGDGTFTIDGAAANLSEAQTGERVAAWLSA